MAIVSLLFAMQSQGQHGWQLHIEQPNDVVPLGATEGSEGKLLVCGMAVDSISAIRYPVIWEVSQAGDLTYTALLAAHSGTAFHDIFWINDTIIVGGIQSRDDTTRLTVYRFTADFELIDTVIFGSVEYTEFIARIRMAPDGDLVFSGFARLPDSLSGDLFVSRFRPGVGPLQTKYFEHPGSQTGFDVLPQADGTYLYAGWNYPYVSGNLQVNILTLDSVFNVTTYIDLDSLLDIEDPGFRRIPSLITMKQLNASNIMIGGEFWFDEQPWEPDFDLGNVVLNQVEQVSHFRRWGVPDDDERTGINGMDFLSPQAVYTAGTAPGSYVENPLFGFWENEYILIKTNQQLDSTWQVAYGLPGHYLRLETIRATTDGGCLLAGTSYDFNNPGNFAQRDLFLVKVDANGNAAPLSAAAPKAAAHAATPYPNPTRDVIQFQVAGEASATIQLFDAVGAQVASYENYQSGSPINISHLATGFYCYRVTSGTETATTGKLIVK